MMVDFAPFFAVLAIVLIKSVILWPLYKFIANLIV
jgi:YggT family protein